jgi:hypothetical protein
MHDIVLIEDFTVNEDGDLIITAILENMGRCTVQQSYWDAPEFAPARCRTVIHAEGLPHGVQFIGLNDDQLEELVNRNSLLVNQEWEVVINDDSDRDLDSCYEGGQLFF